MSLRVRFLTILVTLACFTLGAYADTVYVLPNPNFTPNVNTYDAANLVLVPLARGVQSREGLREAVLSTSVFAGASGILSMTADGNARKRPFLLAVKRGKIVQLD